MSHRPLQFKITLGALIFSGLVFFVYYLGFSNYSSSFLTAGLNPVMRVSHQLTNGLGDFLSLYFQQKDLATKNEGLKSELITLARKNAELSLVKEENEILKKELQFVDEYQYDYLIARVIGRNTDYESDYLLIDKGSRDGLFEGLAVTINQGMVIGRLVKVEDRLSHLQLLTDNNSKIAILVIGAESIPGLSMGEHNLNLKIEMLPKNSKINPGDLVVTSNLNLNVPQGLVLGKIKKIESPDTALWQSAVAETLVDYDSLSLVTIILPAERQ